MQVGTPTPPQPVGTATNANGWVYGLFELALVLIPLLLLTMPLWGKRIIAWLFRPFGAPKENAEDRRE
jgi:hypothetical protein